MAHDEKSKFLFFRPEIAYGKPKTVAGFFFVKYFLILPKRTKPLRPYVFVINNQNGCDSYLLGTSLCIFRIVQNPVLSLEMKC